MSLPRLSLLAAIALNACAPTDPPAGTAQPRAEATCSGSDWMNLDVEGYGEGTVGGWQPGFQVACVTSFDDDGPGTLRDALRTGGAPTVVRFVRSGVIPLSAPLVLPSNLTIDGRGWQIVLSGKGMVIHGQEEVILTNLALEDVGPTSEDGIQIGTVDQASSHIVLDHLRFSQTTGQGSSDDVDEAISVIYGSRDITVQWCRFDLWEKVLLAGNGDADPAVDRQITVTMHHNFFNQTGRRHPRARWGQLDVYNNFFYDWHMYTWAGPPGWHLSHGSKCDEGCRMRLEQNIYERHWHTQDLFSDANKASMCEKGGEITEAGHWITPESDVNLRFGVYCRAGAWERPYEATVDVAGPELQTLLTLDTGNILL